MSRIGENKMNQFLDILCDCPLFEGKERFEIKNILSQAQYKINHYKKNELVFRIDQPSNYIGIVLNGGIELQNIIAEKAINVFYRNRGDVFGEADIFSKNPTYHCDALAKKSSNILLIYKQSVIEILCKDDVINSNILGLLANNVVLLNKKLELYSFSSIQKKIAFCLLYNTEVNDSDSVSLIHSKTSWAEHLNVSRPSLYRELKTLCDAGIIEMKDNKIRILKRKSLESIWDQ